MKLDLKMTENSRPYDRTDLSSQPYNPVPRSGRNVLNLLAQREICPRSRSAPKKQWREASESRTDFCSRPKCQAGVRDARCSLISWVEEKSLRNLSAKYCPLVPPPRSTIAAAFSPDGKTLASTHGDHTVKIIDCQSGNCMKVLTGHRRTPWVVRFHPLHPEILASGSLDQDVRLWNANTSECIECRDFYRPIASIAFHAEGDLLAVASGHKLFIWQYNKGPEASSPIMVLKTRRSLRAVHFHPHGAPYLMTAEVNDLDTSSPSMTRATSLGYLHYPSPAVFVANIHSRDYLLSLAAAQPMTSLPFLLPPATSDDSRIHLQHRSGNIASTSMQVESSARMQYQMDGNATEQYDFMVFPVDASAIPAGSYSMSEETESSHRNDRSSSAYNTVIDVVNTNEMHPVTWSQPRSSSSFDSSSGPSNASHGAFGHTPNNPELVDLGQLHEVNPQGDPLRFDYPPIQGWGMGQGQAVPSFVTNAMPVAVNLSGVPGGSSLSNQVSDSHVSGHEYEDRPVYINIPHDGRGPQPFISRIQSELTQSFAAAAAELPCTVKLRIWSHDVKNPCLLLNSERLRLTIQHAVLCSEMGAHFSPCGRYLAACVACVLPNMECDPGLQTLPNRDAGAATSPTRHPIPTHHVMYELRIYSLEEATFGSVLVSRAIRAAHCLTSIQFSPTSEHVLLAYGRRHGSLLKFIIIDGETFLPIYTVLEVYRASDLELVRVYPSSEDEVNVACFHPYAGGGLVYGTKEGKLRILQYEKDQEMNAISPNNSLYGHMPELQTYALEG